MEASRNRSFYEDATLYDAIAGEPAPGLALYERLAKQSPGPVLALACGTGRYANELARAGLEVTGLDLSSAMLERAKRKAVDDGLSVRYELGDMRRFDLGAGYGFVFIARNSFQHLLTLGDAEACLTSVRAHLARKGRFLIEVFNPDIMILARDPDERFPAGEFTDPETSTAYRIEQTTNYDRASQVNHVTWFIGREHGPDEQILEFEMRCFFPQEFDALIEHNGFGIVEKFGDHDGNPFAADSPLQICLCAMR